MIKRREKHSLSGFLLNEKVLTVLSLVLLILIGIPLVKNINRRNKVNTEIAQLEQEISMIENKNTNLNKLLKYIESDQFVEEQARLNLGMKKPNENVVIVRDSVGPANNAQPAASNIPGMYNITMNDEKAVAKESNLRLWRNYFFK